MQRAYFLGSASPDGFSTPFWTEHRNFYGIYLKGGPGTGKSTLMKKIAAAFPEEPVSLYHCASDPHSLDAVVLEHRGVFVADATAPHEAGTPLPLVTGELLDLGALLDRGAVAAHSEHARKLHAQNQAAHAQARRGLTGLGAMEDTAAAAGCSALLCEKLTGYAARLAKRLFGRQSGSTGTVLHRQCSALTPQGRLTYLPEGCDVLLLADPYRAASQTLLTLLADHAARLGFCAEITRSSSQSGRPVTHLILPALQLALIASADGKEPETEGHITVIRMQRFYDAQKLREQRSLVRFCNQTAALLENKPAGILAEALALHDALEQCYIAALDRPALNSTAAQLCARLRSALP